MQVTLQRAMLLARACNTQSSSSWLALYCQLMKGCEGENIQARRGLELIHELANSLKDHEKPMHVRGNQLFVDNSAIFKQVTLTQVVGSRTFLLSAPLTTCSIAGDQLGQAPGSAHGHLATPA